ncbi:uncharacterized protein N7477_004701 [Penicillium maclennaniae]|uniref:uncharacterized protein n=1 Tax=Penicillium maclennaniae TaxID=1343394 RepID=UPI002540CEF1|nr:uncharacterized protein N7477_004701 [Penicillium maclennaniae]KAJ5674767.1 hypothetical protein N7477_004701 [Penicillium maclennaniae]
METITRALLMNDDSIDRASIDSNRQFAVDDPFPSDPTILDDILNTVETAPPEFGTDNHMDTEPQAQISFHSPEPSETTGAERAFLNRYFLHYHTLYPILHERKFRSEYESHTASRHMPVLANMVLAFGAWLSTDARQDVDKIYFAKAQDHVRKLSMEDKGDMTLVQGLVLLSEFAQKQASPDSSIHYIGTAVRIALALNLHIEPSDTNISELDKEIQRRVWWSVYCAESCSAKIYGRPLLLPEDALITIKPVSNIHENSDDSTVYTGLILQSSYHRMANQIYRRLLATPTITPQDVHEVEQIINAWHSGSSFCVQLTDRSSTPDWHVAARRRQILCDQSLRLLIHRPLLLRWLKSKSMNSGPLAETHPDELHCRAQGLKIARATIGLVPLIHLKADPASPGSITCIQDIKKAEVALDHLYIDRDALSGYFVFVMRRLFQVASRISSEHYGQTLSHSNQNTVKPQDVQPSPNSIFGNVEMALLEDDAPRSSSGFDFSDWVHS